MTKLEKILRERNIYISNHERRGGITKVAEEIGIHRETISRHMFKHRVMRRINLEKIAAYLKVSVVDITD